MVRNIFKGYSLVEALAVLIIVAILFAAGAKVFTKKQKKDVITFQHGNYECYNDGTNYISKYTIEGQEGITNTTSDTCVFKPSQDVTLYHIYLIYKNQTGYDLITVQNISEELSFKFLNGISIENKSTSDSSHYGPAPTIENGGDYETLKNSIEKVYKDVKIISENNVGTTSDGVLIIW